MPKLNRPTAIIIAAFLVLLFTTSPAWPPQPAHPQAAAAGAALATPGQATVPTGLQRATATPPLITLAVPTPAPPTPTPLVLPTTGAPSTALGNTLDGYLKQLVQAGLFQGAVLVAHSGQVVLDQGYGLADAAHKLPNTPQTRFQIASMTKQFTALAALQLVARRQLALDASVCTYLDDCPAAWKPVIIRQLLNHTSGLPNYTDLASFNTTQTRPATPTELIATIRDLPLIFTPGSTYMYENTDYVLLGMIIERVSGMSYGDFLQLHIFAPLGMDNTGAADTAPPAPNQALGYSTPGELAPILHPTTLFSAGGIHSTVEDMYRWDQALYTNQLLPQELRDQLWTPGMGAYGYGWRISTRSGHRMISHAGLMDGFAGMIARFPDDRLTVIVLGNMSAADPEGIAGYLADLVFQST